jgi:hypothetical protein
MPSSNILSSNIRPQIAILKCLILNCRHAAKITFFCSTLYIERFFGLSKIKFLAEDSFRTFLQVFTPIEFAQEFCFYNINAPDQEKNAEQISSSTHYPTMENLADIINEIVRHFE